MKCPICDIDMRIAEREGVEIDYCSQCRGVWLDRGELEKIIARVESQESRDCDEQEKDQEERERYRGRRAEPYRGNEPETPGDRRREGQDPNQPKKKEGLFSNLLDMFGD